MSIYIKGMEMPKDGSWKTIRIYPDGTCAIPNWQGDCTFIKDTKVVPVQPHGRLIDADALDDLLMNLGDNEYTPKVFASWLSYEENAPTIIPADEGKT